MKPGDKVWFKGETVWFLSGDEIKHGILTDHYRCGACLDVMTKFICDGSVSTRHALVEPDLAFPTREALCEHYRKIFE